MARPSRNAGGSRKGKREQNNLAKFYPRASWKMEATGQTFGLSGGGAMEL
jgi:hypothetical protein